MTEEYGELLRRLRKQAGLTQIELANLAGITGQAVSLHELGVTEPEPENALACLAAIDKTLVLTPENKFAFLLLAGGFPMEVAQQAITQIKAPPKTRVREAKGLFGQSVVTLTFSTGDQEIVKAVKKLLGSG